MTLFMLMKSFVRDTLGLSAVDVEVVLQKGIPKIEILGLPDRGVQESLSRIQSAIMAQGFEFPRSHKVVVNVRPIDSKTSSLGLELAIALGILHLTSQRELPQISNLYIYGELSLSGTVHAPKDTGLIPMIDGVLMTGSLEGIYLPERIEVQTIEALTGELLRETQSSKALTFLRPTGTVESLGAQAARLLEVVAVGEHSVLLAGPSGTGKTTFAQLVQSFLRAPDTELLWEIHRIGQIFNESRQWRPMVMPHHSISVSSMLGGGLSAKPGAIFKAHGGVLVLDEMLEFHTTIQSALREPIEQKTITISKNTQHRTYKSSFLTVGATNLCRCGGFVPKASQRCRCTSLELRRYIERLSGPFRDRFSILAFTHLWSEGEDKVSTSEILVRIERAIEFSTKRSLKINDDLLEDEVLADSESDKQSFPAFKSWRRYLSFLRVSRTLADLDLSVKIHRKHFLEAYELTTQTHSAIDDLFLGH